jgi:hypothetical protein
VLLRVIGALAQKACDLFDLLHPSDGLCGLVAIEDVHGRQHELRPPNLEGGHHRRPRDLLGRDVRRLLLLAGLLLRLDRREDELAGDAEKVHLAAVV